MRLALAVTLLWCSTALAVESPKAGMAKPGMPKPTGPGPDAFEKLKSLAGDWDGTTTMGSVKVNYRLSSNDSIVVETLGTSHGEMLTIYHLDKGTLVLTHYCSAGNQPHMKTAGLQGDKLSFAEDSISNFPDPNGLYMAAVSFTFKDGDHFSQEWTNKQAGKSETKLFQYTRAKR